MKLSDRKIIKKIENHSIFSDYDMIHKTNNNVVITAIENVFSCILNHNHLNLSFETLFTDIDEDEMENLLNDLKLEIYNQTDNGDILSINFNSSMKLKQIIDFIYSK